MGINPVAENVTTAVTSIAATTSSVASTTHTTVIAHEVVTDTNSTIPIDKKTFKVPRPTNSKNWMIVGSSPPPDESRNLESKDQTPLHLQVRGGYALSMKSVDDTENSMGFQDMVHRTTRLSPQESRSRLETFKGFSPDADASEEPDEDISTQRDYLQFLENVANIEGVVKLNDQAITEKFAVLGPFGALADIVDNHVDFDLEKKCPAVASLPPSVPSLGRKNKPISLDDPNSTKTKSKKVSIHFYLFIIIRLYRGSDTHDY